jgi:hypothetical protein
VVDGLSNRQIARGLGCSAGLVRLRIQKLARHALLEHERRSGSLSIAEPISYDGIENFARSQYEPNNINHAIGSKSLFIYDFDFAALNRKGRMSDRQKRRKAELEDLEGHFPKNAMELSTGRIFKRLHGRCKPGQKLEILSDEHFQYRRAIRKNFKATEIEHTTISSRATRLYRHILFSVNHTDLLLRQCLKAFARETISFSKTHRAMCLKYALLMIWKNYMRPQFVKSHKQDPAANHRTPAMAVGITDKILSFGECFGRRIFESQVELNETWKLIYRNEALCPKVK